MFNPFLVILLESCSSISKVRQFIISSSSIASSSPLASLKHFEIGLLPHGRADDIHNKESKREWRPKILQGRHTGLLGFRTWPPCHRTTLHCTDDTAWISSSTVKNFKKKKIKSSSLEAKLWSQKAKLWLAQQASGFGLDLPSFSTHLGRPGKCISAALCIHEKKKCGTLWPWATLDDAFKRNKPKNEWVSVGVNTVMKVWT